MKKIIMVVVIMIMILVVVVVLNGSEKNEKVGKYEYKQSGVIFKEDTENLRKFFEKNLDDKNMVNVALGIHANGDYVAYRESDE